MAEAVDMDAFCKQFEVFCNFGNTGAKKKVINTKNLTKMLKVGLLF